MFLSYIIHDRMVKIVTCNFHRSRNNYSAYRYHSHICSSRTDIHDQISKRLGNIYSRTDRSRNRFFHEKYFPGSGLICCFLHSLTLNLCNTTRNTDADSRLTERSSSHSLGNKIFQHLFHYIIIYDHTSSDWPDHFHIGSQMACHLSGFLTNCSDLLCIFIINNHRGLS